jgi:hypothetical protein
LRHVLLKQQKLGVKGPAKGECGRGAAEREQSLGPRAACGRPFRLSEGPEAPIANQTLAPPKTRPSSAWQHLEARVEAAKAARCHRLPLFPAAASTAPTVLHGPSEGAWLQTGVPGRVGNSCSSQAYAPNLNAGPLSQVPSISWAATAGYGCQEQEQTGFRMKAACRSGGAFG